MIAKRILTAVLLFFVAVSLGVLIAKHYRHGEESVANLARNSPTSDGVEKVIVYYFHPHARCENCRNIEAYAKEAVETGFPQELADGRIEWQVVDFDQPANQHFDKEFKLGGIASVALAKIKSGKIADGLVIPNAWSAVNSATKREFIDFVQSEIRDFSKNSGDDNNESDAPKNNTARDSESKSATQAGLDIPKASSNQFSRNKESWLQSFAWGLPWALWLGIFTAITPCTLVSNVAAVSYISRKVGSPRSLLTTALLYAIGQVLAYAVLGFLLVAGLLAQTEVSSFLHRYLNELLGPLLMITAMFLLGLIEIGTTGPGINERLQKRIDAMGLWGAFLLGVLFALTFCPVSGVLFFFQLIPQAVLVHSRIALPAFYGLGNVLPVLAFAFLLAFSAQSVGKVFNRLTQIERWLQWLTGMIFLLAGFYFILYNIFDLPLPKLLATGGK